MSRENRIEIPDGNIVHIWEGSDGDTIGLDPSWYEQNGTPMDDEGNDMIYIKTELILNEACPVQRK